MKGKRRGLWPSWPDERTKRIILTEGMLDAATLLYYTEETVLALYSTSGFGQDQLTAIQGLPELEEVVFFLDGDEAGRKAVEQHSKLLHELLPGITISAVATPDDEDVNSLAVTYDNPDEVLSGLITNRVELFSLIGKNESRQEVASDDHVVLPNDHVVLSSPIKEKALGQLNTHNPHRITYTGMAAKYQVLAGWAKHWTA